jgi:hypothetical protein
VVLATADCRKADPGRTARDLLTGERTTLMFKLYYAPGTCALATHIALEKAGAPYEAVPVDFGSQAQRSPEYLAINPKGRVPALVTERGTLTETPGLLLFVAQRFPKTELKRLSRNRDRQLRSSSGASARKEHRSPPPLASTSRETGSSNPVSSSGESVSLPELLSRVENPGFPRGCARLAWRPGRQRRAGCYKIGPTGDNISVAPYSSTAAALMGSARMRRPK